MVTIPGELNKEHFKFHLISESDKKMENEWNKRIRINEEEMKGCCGFNVHQRKYIRREL
jgi:hypothetical protein